MFSTSSFARPSVPKRRAPLIIVGQTASDNPGSADVIPTGPNFGQVYLIRNERRFDELTRGRTGMTVVKYYLPNCPACNSVETSYNTASMKYPNVCFLKVEATREAMLPRNSAPPDYVPTFCIYVDGAVRDTVVGANRDALEASIEELFRGSSV